MIRVRLLVDLDLSRRKGDVVEVAEGYGRTYLLQNGLAERLEESKQSEWKTKQLTAQESLDKRVVLEEFRRQMYLGGLRKWSVNGLNRVFDSVNRDSQDETLDEDEFEEAINKFGVFLDKRSIKTLFRAFDSSKDGRIDSLEFLVGLRGAMNERRYHIVKKAWDALEKKSPSALSVEDVVQLTGVENHPSVAAGLASPEQVAETLSDGLAKWSQDAAYVDESGFIKHFTDVSGAIDSDAVFVDMIERQFGVSEKGVDTKTRDLVQSFREKLLGKVEQKAPPGAGPERTLVRAFQFVNADSVGKVTLPEFRAAMEQFGFHGPQVDQVFNFFDRSRDGQIDYNEFIQGMR